MKIGAGAPHFVALDEMPGDEVLQDQHGNNANQTRTKQKQPAPAWAERCQTNSLRNLVDYFLLETHDVSDIDT